MELEETFATPTKEGKILLYTYEDDRGDLRKKTLPKHCGVELRFAPLVFEGMREPFTIEIVAVKDGEITHFYDSMEFMWVPLSDTNVEIFEDKE